MTMMNVKETLKRLRKKLPTLSLDDLFDVLDCYVEEVSLSGTIPTWKPSWEQPKIWYSTDKTTSVSETPTINCITSKNADPAICTIANTCTDGKIKYYDGAGSAQPVSEY